MAKFVGKSIFDVESSISLHSYITVLLISLVVQVVNCARCVRGNFLVCVLHDNARLIFLVQLRTSLLFRSTLDHFLFAFEQYMWEVERIFFFIHEICESDY